jgi:DNA (cytosine-5)-methyltransferase 1
MSFKHMPGKLHGTILESVSETFSRHRVIVRQDEDGWNKANNHHMTEEETPSRTVSPEPNGTATEVVDLLSESEPDEAFQADDFLSDEDIESLLQSWNEQPQLNREPSPLLRPRSTIPSARVNDIIVMPGMSVELAEGGFLRILEILQDRLDVFLRGYHFMKLNDLSAPVPRWDQEVCWIIKRDEYGDIISEKEVPLSSTLGIVQLSLTNRPRSHQTRDRQIGVRQTSIRPRLYLCRLQWLCVSHGSELIIRYLTPEEADEGYRTESYMLRKKWRGATKYFGSDMVDGQQLYSFGDGFCGAGGISCGAKAAGLNLQWSFDHDKYAMITYTKNFPDSTFHLAGFDQFMTNPSHEIQVDISHTSPPCQTWSPAHTVMSDNDDHNSALLYSSYNLIPKVKPRIHTIEQTSGLSERHQDHYHCVIRDTLELGYSVHTKVVSCQDYGIPQTRKRLVFIAAG